jgi:hypothetical protein
MTTPTHKESLHAFHQGFGAASKGIGRERNPHLPASGLHHAWETGHKSFVPRKARWEVSADGHIHLSVEG